MDWATKVKSKIYIYKKTRHMQQNIAKKKYVAKIKSYGHIRDH